MADRSIEKGRGMHYCSGSNMDNYSTNPTSDDPDFQLVAVPFIGSKDGINHSENTETVRWNPDGTPVEQMGPPVGTGHENQQGSTPPPPPTPEDGEKIRKMLLESANVYQPWTHTVNEPYIPQPYDHWRPEQSYIQFIPEHRKNDFQL